MVQFLYLGKEQILALVNLSYGVRHTPRVTRIVTRLIFRDPPSSIIRTDNRCQRPGVVYDILNPWRGRSGFPAARHERGDMARNYEELQTKMDPASLADNQQRVREELDRMSLEELRGGKPVTPADMAEPPEAP